MNNEIVEHKTQSREYSRIIGDIHRLSYIPPLCAGVDPLSFLSLTETTPVSMSILKCDRSPLYAAAWAGNAKSIVKKVEVVSKKK